MITLNCQHHDVMPMPADDSVAPAPSSEACLRVMNRLRELYSHRGKPHLFGELVLPSSGAQDPSSKACLRECNTRIRLSRFGQMVERAIDELPKGLPIAILERVVMPNHVHFVIRVLEQLPEDTPLGIIIKNFKTTVNQIYKTLRGVPLSTRMQYPGCEGKHPTAGLVFAPDYHERFLFRNGQLQTMIDYCRDNPARLASQVMHPEYFCRISKMQVTLPWLPQGGTKGQRSAGVMFPNLLAPVVVSEAKGSEAKGSEARLGVVDQARCGVMDGACLQEMTATFTLDAIGNRALLQEPERVQIQCSRTMTAEALEEETAAVLDLCSKGMVPVCPCMNSNERHIAEACLSAGYRLIVIDIEGLRPDLPEYKPMGRRFAAYQRGQLLLLSPWVSATLRGTPRSNERGTTRSNGRGTTRSNKPSRAECLFQNDLAAMLTAFDGTIVEG